MFVGALYVAPPKCREGAQEAEVHLKCLAPSLLPLSCCITACRVDLNEQLVNAFVIGTERPLKRSGAQEWQSRARRGGREHPEPAGQGPS